MIEASSIGKQYNDLIALEHVSFQIHPGEVVGLLGPNGAGKTTTLRILTGYMPPTSGNVFIAGHNLSDEPRAAKQKLGYLPEIPPLYPELTVNETLSFAAELRGIPRAERRDRIDSTLEKTKLLDVRHRIIAHLSKGYHQRVGIAQAILHNPPYLILDEPTIGLDPRQIIEIRELISELARGRGNSAILLSTHILQEVTSVCDRVIILNRGRIVANERIDHLIDQHQGSDLEEIFLRLTDQANDPALPSREHGGLGAIGGAASNKIDAGRNLQRRTGPPL